MSDRRALMGVLSSGSGGDDTLLYKLPQTTVFDGTSYIDTGVTPFKTDHDFTVAFEFEWETTSNQLTCIFRCGEPRFALQGKSSGAWRFYLTQSGGNYWAATVASGTRAKAVVTHTQGGAFNMYVLVNGGTLNSTTKTGWSLATTNKTLYIGTNQDNGSQYNLHGTVYDFQIYSRAWSSEEVSGYLTFA